MSKATKRKTNPAVTLPPKTKVLTVIKPARPMTESEALLQFIKKSAVDHTVDTDKLQTVVNLYNQQRERQTETEFFDAMSAAQSSMDPVRRDCYNPQTKSRYASYAALDAKIRPIYSRHGFALSFNTAETSAADLLVVTCVCAKGGHKEHYRFPVPVSSKGPQGKEFMTPTHAQMSAKTYGMRALLGMIFNIATIDDDGNAAGAGPTVSAEQLIELEALLEQTKTDIDRFCAFLRITELGALPASRFAEAKKALKLKAERT